MRRRHQQDLSGHLLEQGGWEHLCLPAEYEGSGRASVGLLGGRQRVSQDRSRAGPRSLFAKDVTPTLFAGHNERSEQKLRFNSRCTLRQHKERWRSFRRFVVWQTQSCPNWWSLDGARRTHPRQVRRMATTVGWKSHSPGEAGWKTVFLGARQSPQRLGEKVGRPSFRGAKCFIFNNLALVKNELYGLRYKTVTQKARFGASETALYRHRASHASIPSHPLGLKFSLLFRRLHWTLHDVG